MSVMPPPNNLSGRVVIYCLLLKMKKERYPRAYQPRQDEWQAGVHQPVSKTQQPQTQYFRLKFRTTTFSWQIKFKVTARDLVCQQMLDCWPGQSIQSDLKRTVIDDCRA